MNQAIEILIIEDEPGHREALVEALEREGYAVSAAADGHDGLERFARSDPYVVVTDLKLGGSIDGMEVLERVLADRRTCEVVMITAHGSVDNCKEALRKGAYDYIEKPIDLDLLRVVVKRAAEKVRLARENRRLHDRLDEKFG
ncbi:MAG: response regulator, partial [Sedimentisphaerales bacterium]|nr:response regulator [Sedimentisphaerales bacterium]